MTYHKVEQHGKQVCCLSWFNVLMFCEVYPSYNHRVIAIVLLLSIHPCQASLKYYALTFSPDCWHCFNWPLIICCLRTVSFVDWFGKYLHSQAKSLYDGILCVHSLYMSMCHYFGLTWRYRQKKQSVQIVHIAFNKNLSCFFFKAKLHRSIYTLHMFWFLLHSYNVLFYRCMIKRKEI